MRHWTIATLARSAVVMALAALPAVPAEARDFRASCRAGSTSPETARVVIDIPKLALDARLAQPGEGDYEMSFFGDVSLRDLDPRRPRWAGRPRCQQNFQWDERWPAPRRFYPTPTGDMSEHPAGFRFVIDNVPADSLLTFRFAASEEDRGSADIIGFAPGARGEWLELEINTGQRSARVLAGGAARQTLGFDRAERIYGGRKRGPAYNGAVELTLRARGVRPNPYYDGPPATDPQPPQENANLLLCRKYARDAMAYVNEGRRLGCGFSGADWANDRQRHFRWCMRGDNIASAALQNERRKGALEACRTAQADTGGGQSGTGAGQRPSDASCDAYARAAVIDAQSAIDNKCDFTGGRWSLEYDVHFDWCIDGARPSDLQAEKVARGQDLYQCAISKGGDK